MKGWSYIWEENAPKLTFAERPRLAVARCLAESLTFLIRIDYRLRYTISWIIGYPIHGTIWKNVNGGVIFENLISIYLFEHFYTCSFCTDYVEFFVPFLTFQSSIRIFARSFIRLPAEDRTLWTIIFRQLVVEAGKVDDGVVECWDPSPIIRQQSIHKIVLV